MQRAISLARFHGIRRIEATPYVDNPGAVKFFEQLAEFEYEGLRRDGGCRDGQLMSTYLYAWVDA